jgi:hypothetical protein
MLRLDGWFSWGLGALKGNVPFSEMRLAGFLSRRQLCEVSRGAPPSACHHGKPRHVARAGTSTAPGGALDQVLLVQHEDHLQGRSWTGSICHDPGQASNLTASHQVTVLRAITALMAQRLATQAP